METRTRSEKAEKILSSFSYDRESCVEEKVFSEGIWMFWSSSEVEIEILSTNWQFIHVVVKCNSGQEWLLSTVYASPEEKSYVKNYENILS